mmetsp:Transcript_9929/g.24581  ORF Transcript_9929/g.24581 Transcript_9929/m.24581 type:complete len:285 (-) Transcript_9929:1660-2514(-)
MRGVGSCDELWDARLAPLGLAFWAVRGVGFCDVPGEFRFSRANPLWCEFCATRGVELRGVTEVPCLSTAAPFWFGTCTARGVAFRGVPATPCRLSGNTARGVRFCFSGTTPLGVEFSFPSFPFSAALGVALNLSTLLGVTLSFPAPRPSTSCDLSACTFDASFCRWSAVVSFSSSSFSGRLPLASASLASIFNSRRRAASFSTASFLESLPSFSGAAIFFCAASLPCLLLLGVACFRSAPSFTLSSSPVTFSFVATFSLAAASAPVSRFFLAASFSAFSVSINA